MTCLPDNRCALCGIDLRGARRRFQVYDELKAFVVARCQPTPFVYEALVARSGSHRQCMCIPCVNWKRRVNGKGGLKRCARPLLQLDQLILFLMQPGVVLEPDSRCTDRLFRAIKQACNPYRPSYPFPVACILEAMRGDSYAHAVTAWWEFNGRTEFFRSPGEAKRVRQAMKQGYIQPDEDEPCAVQDDAQDDAQGMREQTGGV